MTLADEPTSVADRRPIPDIGAWMDDLPLTVLSCRRPMFVLPKLQGWSGLGAIAVAAA